MEIFPYIWELCVEDAQRSEERGCPGAWALSKLLPTIGPLWNLQWVHKTGSSTDFFFLNVIWVLWFRLGLFPALSLCKDVCGSLNDLSDRDDLQGVWDWGMLPCGWWDRSALAKCPAWQLPTGSCSEPLPQRCGKILTWGVPPALGGAGEPLTSSPEINGPPDVSCVSPAGTLGCHWCAEVGQQGNNTLEREEEIQGQCHWCELRSWARWCGRQYPSPSFPSSLAMTLWVVLYETWFCYVSDIIT